MTDDPALIIDRTLNPEPSMHGFARGSHPAGLLVASGARREGANAFLAERKAAFRRV
jgi:hypothetical protein